MSRTPERYVPTLRRAGEGWQLESGQRVCMKFLERDARNGVLMFQDLQEIGAADARDVFQRAQAGAA